MSTFKTVEQMQAEIERLREALEQLAHLEGYGSSQWNDIARAALQAGESDQ